MNNTKTAGGSWQWLGCVCVHVCSFARLVLCCVRVFVCECMALNVTCVSNKQRNKRALVAHVIVCVFVCV